MNVTSAFPIITTPDLERALGFYRDVLGGVVSSAFPPEGPPGTSASTSGRRTLGIGHDPAVDLTGASAHGAAGVRRRLRLPQSRRCAVPEAPSSRNRSTSRGRAGRPGRGPDGNRVIIGQASRRLEPSVEIASFDAASTDSGLTAVRRPGPHAGPCRAPSAGFVDRGRDSWGAQRRQRLLDGGTEVVERRRAPRVGARRGHDVAPLGVGRPTTATSATAGEPRSTPRPGRATRSRHR